MSDNTLDNNALDLLFREARSQNAYVNAPLTDDMLKELYDIWKYGPTSANCSPARVIFVRSEEGKAKLLPHLMGCLLYTSPSPRDRSLSRMPSSA